jgi:hypothetical protein
MGVLRQVDEIIRARGQAMVLDAPPVGEVSTGPVVTRPAASPPLAHCSVRGHILAYDTNRYGALPVNEPFIVRYTVELRSHGLFVSFD